MGFCIGDIIWWFLYSNVGWKNFFSIFFFQIHIHYNSWIRLFPQTSHKITISKAPYIKITVKTSYNIKSPYKNHHIKNHSLQSYSINTKTMRFFGYFIIILMVVLLGDLRDLVGSFVWWFCMVILYGDF